MGEYRFSIGFKLQIGLLLSFDGQIALSLPFIEIRVATSKEAHGYNILGLFYN